MRVAVITAIRESWDEVPLLLTELRSALAQWTELDASIWLIDDASSFRPDSWNALDKPGEEIHVIELQGRQGRNRSFTTALGYLIYEREENFDAFLLLDLPRPQEARRLEPLFEAAIRQPKSIVFTPGGATGSGPFKRLQYRAKCAFLHALCGERVLQSPALFIPAASAESLCQSCHGASHVEATLQRLKLKAVSAAMPKNASGLNVIAAASVFRDRVFARTFFAASLFFVIALAATPFLVAMSYSGFVCAGSFFLAMLFGCIAMASLLFGVFSLSLSETRRWIPALDAPLLIRAVIRVKKQPYIVA